jgi:hypothetical protein
MSAPGGKIGATFEGTPITVESFAGKPLLLMFYQACDETSGRAQSQSREFPVLQRGEKYDKNHLV